MSYEGFEQHICDAGHRFDVGSGHQFSEAIICDCGKPSSWVNYVDQTNGPSEGVIPEEAFDKLQLTPAVFEECGTCKHRKQTAEATYRIPTHDETDAMRGRDVYVDGKWVHLKRGEDEPVRLSRG